MKQQKQAIISRKATKTSVVAKKRRTFHERPHILELKKEKKFKKLEILDESKKKVEVELKKKNVRTEKKKQKFEKIEETKQKLIKEIIDKFEKECDKMVGKKDDEKQDIDLNDSPDKKKSNNLDVKIKNDKQYIQGVKKKFEKDEEKDEKIKFLNGVEDVIFENKLENKIVMLPVKKRLKENNTKKKDEKLIKLEFKDNPKMITAKDIKNLERKRSMEREELQKQFPIKMKKELKIKQPSKKNSNKKSISSTKKSHFPVVQKLFDKKSKLVKSTQVAETLSPSLLLLTNFEKTKNLKRDKNKSLLKGKDVLVKNFNDQKSEKSTRFYKKNAKINLSVKNGNLENNYTKKRDLIKDSKTNSNEIKNCPKLESYIVCTDNIKKEILDEKELIDKIKEDSKKNLKSKVIKKIIKKSSKYLKYQNDSDIEKNEVISDEDLKKQSKIESQLKTLINSSKDEKDLTKVSLKVEAANGESGKNMSTSESENNDEDYNRRSRSKIFEKCKEHTISEEQAMTNRLKLFGFWSGPKRHRVASLNALAKVHCLYENENGGAYLGGFCKPKSEKEKEKDKDNKLRKCKEEKEDKDLKKEKKCNIKEYEITARRKLRNVPGLRGKHYDVLDGLISSSSSDEDLELRREKEKERKKKEKEKERLERIKEKKIIEDKEKEKRKEVEKEIETVSLKKPKQKRKKKNTEIMDLKDMVVCKRMASLNASAILAASYSDEKNRLDTSSESSSSSESDVEFIRRCRQSDSDIDKRKQRQVGSDADDLVNPSKKVIIVNQDTDVTITGVYVNQTRSTHHEGFCSIAGMKYLISSTSHTQTAATAVATELHDQKEQPCKSYTPLGALSSMQPPGTQGNHSNMSPRRHSAFSTPHQHGYYQPAGPLIQHPAALPSVKGPPPDTTPTPPQNSESSDDLITTSTTSSGTNSTGGGFYRTYCPQYYATPPQYQDLCYSPSYSHSHSHPPPYYHKYAPPYRRHYYGYQETGVGGSPSNSGTSPGIVEYQPPPNEYLSYYGGYPPPPQPPPPPPNPVYLHTQARPFVDHAFQSCPCPMQSCPKNADTGPLIGNGKGAPVVSGPGLSLPPSALVGPPSPARGLAGLAPPHGSNAWDTDRVQLNAAHHSHKQSQQHQQLQLVSEKAGHNNQTNADCITKENKDRTEGKICSSKCSCSEKQSANCDIKLEQNISPDNITTDEPNLFAEKSHRQHQHHQALKLENNNVKYESCSVEFQQRHIIISKSPTIAVVKEIPQQHQQLEHVTCLHDCRVKCESDYKCEIFKCEQCVTDREQLTIIEMDKESRILDDNTISGKLQTGSEVKEELNTMIDSVQWKKPDYEPLATEPVLEGNKKANNNEKNKDKNYCTKDYKNYEIKNQHFEQRCQKSNIRKLSLDSLSDFPKLKKINKRTVSVGSSRDFAMFHPMVTSTVSFVNSSETDAIEENGNVKEPSNLLKKKSMNKETQNHKRKLQTFNSYETPLKKSKSTSIKTVASDTSIMETINSVIQQSLQMSKKSTKIKKIKSGSNAKIKKKKKNDNIKFLPTIKRTSKKLDLIKSAVSEKFGIIRNEIKNNEHNINNNMDVKLKCKVQNITAKNNKSKSRVLEVKKNFHKFLEIKNNKFLQVKNNSNKTLVIKSVDITESKNDNKILDSKTNNKIVENKNNKALQTKNTNKFLETKYNKKRNQEYKETKECKNSKALKQIKEMKSGVITNSVLISGLVSTSVLASATPNTFNLKNIKSNKMKSRLQQTMLQIKKDKKKSRNTKKSIGRKETLYKIEEQIKESVGKCLSIPRKSVLKPKWSNGWSWDGDAFEAKVYLTNEESAIRRCYVSMKHESGDVLRPLDCVLLKSGPRKADLPFVAKIAALWENPDDGEMMFSLLWYYRPEHTEQGRADNDTDDEVFASRHRDANSVACIEDKCYILTFNEYCRYRKNLRRIEEGLDSPGLIVPPGDHLYPREIRQPPIPVPQDMVLFCRRVYDYRSKKLIKNPG